MTPEQHYAEAERLLKSVEPVEIARRRPSNVGRYVDEALAKAQVHATLALYRPTDEESR